MSAARLVSRALAMLMLSASPVYAHLLPKHTATINLVDRAAFCVVSVPVSALTGVDDDANGLLSLAEIQRHTASIQQQFESRFRLSSDRLVGAGVLSWVTSPVTDGSKPETDYVVIMHRTNFDAIPTQLTVATDLFGTRSDESQLIVTTTRGMNAAKSTEVAVLSATSPRHTFSAAQWPAVLQLARRAFVPFELGPVHLGLLLSILAMLVYRRRAGMSH